MSESWGYVCESHDPPLESDRWLNRGADALADLARKMRDGTWPLAADLDPEYALAYGDEPAPMEYWRGETSAVPVAPVPGGGSPPYSGPPNWFSEHLNCRIALRSEYGERREIT